MKRFKISARFAALVLMIMAALLVFFAKDVAALFDDGSNPCPSGGPCTIGGDVTFSGPISTTTGTFTGDVTVGGSIDVAGRFEAGVNNFFTGAQGVFSQTAISTGYLLPVGVVGEAKSLATGSSIGTGVRGNAKTLATTDAVGVYGSGGVGTSGDAATTYGGQFHASSIHAGGDNIALYCNAANGVNDYCYYGNGGDFLQNDLATFGATVEHLNGTTGRLMVHSNYSASALSVGASGATRTETGGYLTIHLDATSEYAYLNFEIEDNWDGTTVEVDVYTSLGDAETINNVIHASLRIDSTTGEGGNLAGATTETKAILHDIGSDFTQYDNHELVFQLTPANLTMGDVVGLRFWLDDVSANSSVQAVEVIQFSVKYRTKTAWPSAVGGFDSEG